MATANISSTFDITVVGPGDLNVLKTFTASRSFTVTGITANNTAAGASTLIIANAGVVLTATAAGVQGTGIVQAQAVVGPVSTVGVFAGASTVATGAAVTLITGDATVTSVVLHCTAAGLGEGINIT